MPHHTSWGRSSPPERPGGTAAPRRGWRCFVFAGLIALLAGGAAAAVLSAQGRKLIDGLVGGYRTDFAFVPLNDAQRVMIPGDPALVGDYRSGSPSAPLIVLAHGSSVLGRRAPLMRLLARELELRGFSVLSLDLRGFGESGNPALPLTAEFSLSADLAAAASAALAKRWARQGQIVYVGHSLGAAAALQAARLEPQPIAVIAIGYPRLHAYLEALAESDRRSFAGRILDNMRLKADRASIERMLSYLMSLDAPRMVREVDIPPTLFIYGEREGLADAEAEALAPVGTPHEVRVVADAPHGYHASGGPFGLVVYNRAMLETLADWIDDWTRGAERSGA